MKKDEFLLLAALVAAGAGVALVPKQDVPESQIPTAEVVSSAPEHIQGYRTNLFSTKDIAALIAADIEPDFANGYASLTFNHGRKPFPSVDSLIQQKNYQDTIRACFTKHEEGRDHALFIFATRAGDPFLYEGSLDFFKQVNEQYNVDVVFANTPSDIAAAEALVQPNTTNVTLLGHTQGYQPTLADRLFLGEDYRQQPADLSYTISTNDLSSLSWLAKTPENCSVIIVACAAGAFPQSLGPKIHQTFGRTTYAAANSFEPRNMSVASAHPLVPLFLGEGKNLTQIYR